MQQHALGRVDPEALEQLGMPQGQLDHLADLVNRVAQPADIVVGDVGAVAVPGLLVEGAQLDLGAFGHVDDAARLRRHDAEADLLQAVGGQVEVGAQLRRQPRVGAAAALGRGGDDVAGDQGPAEERSPQGLARPLKADVLLGRRDHDAGGGADLGPAHLDVVAARRAGIDPLQAVEADQAEALVLLVGPDRHRGRVALADDLDDVALVQAELVQGRLRQAGDAAAAILRPRIGDLELEGLTVGIRHPVLHRRGAQRTGRPEPGRGVSAKPTASRRTGSGGGRFGRAFPRIARLWYRVASSSRSAG